MNQSNILDTNALSADVIAFAGKRRDRKTSITELSKIRESRDRITYARVMSERSSIKGTGRMPWH